MLRELRRKDSAPRQRGRAWGSWGWGQGREGFTASRKLGSVRGRVGFSQVRIGWEGAPDSGKGCANA